MPLQKILIIDDDRAVVSALKISLETAYEVHVAYHASSGARKATHDIYDAILLDLHLGDTPGSVVCQRIRKDDIITPILIITADNSPLKKLQLFDNGADDYIVKPFHVEELKARIRNLVKRTSGKGRSHGIIRFGGIILNANERTVSRDGQPVVLRPKEFDLLECLMNRSGAVVTRDMLINYAWDGNHATWNNSIDVHIKYLRDKIDRPFDVPLIQTIHGLGYSLRKPLPKATSTKTKSTA